MNAHTVAYVRVSSADQNEARRLEALDAAGGYDKLFTEKISAKERKRSALEAMLGHVREGDVVKVKSIDRLTRSTTDLLSIVQDLSDKDVSVEFIDTPDMNVRTGQGGLLKVWLTSRLDKFQEGWKSCQRSTPMSSSNQRSSSWTME